MKNGLEAEDAKRMQIRLPPGPYSRSVAPNAIRSCRADRRGSACSGPSGRSAKISATPTDESPMNGTTRRKKYGAARCSGSHPHPHEPADIIGISLLRSEHRRPHGRRADRKRRECLRQEIIRRTDDKNMYSGTVRRHTGQRSPMQRSFRLHFPDPAAGERPYPTRAPNFPPFFLRPFSSRPEQGSVRKSRKLRRVGTSSYRRKKRTVLIKDKNEQGLSFHPSPPIDTCRTGSSDANACPTRSSASAHRTTSGGPPRSVFIR